jgi:NADPH:quinone reductase-like Zn-dependent oxidoreductase
MVRMRALTTGGYGPPTNLAMAEVEAPSPGPGQVLVDVTAASVNPFDIQLVSGDLREHFPLTFPYVIGMDCAGTVAALGPGVTRFSVGDEVFGMLRETPGTVAQLAVAIAASPMVERMPSGLDPIAAAAIPGAGLTALTLLRAARLRPGETALVIGASGGIGMVLVPLAAATGATVVATANAADAEYVRGLGAAETIDHTSADTIDETLRRHACGVDVLFNLVHDGDAIVRAARAVRSGGRLVTARPVFDTSPFRDDVAVASVFLTAEPGDLDDLGRRAASGALHVEVRRVYPFEQSGQAFVDQVAEHSRGKRVIAVRAGS